MDIEKKTDFSADAEAAVELEAEAKAGPDVTVYTHTLKKGSLPFCVPSILSRSYVAVHIVSLTFACPS